MEFLTMKHQVFFCGLDLDTYIRFVLLFQLCKAEIFARLKHLPLACSKIPRRVGAVGCNNEVASYSSVPPSS